MQNIRYPIIGKQTVYPVYLTGIGISEYEYHINRENGLVSHQFLFTKKGAGTLKVDGKTYRLGEGSFFYISPSVPHEYYPESGQWTTCWLVFRGNYLRELMDGLGFPEYFICENSDLSAFEKLFGMILAADDPVFGGEKCSMLLYQYILAARHFISGEEQSAATDGIVGTAAAYIEENYMNDITLDELSELSGVSPQHFCRLFRARMGMRPLEYIARRRITQAKLLLRKTEDSVSEIGAKIGYPDPTYFGVVFRKYEGIAPSKYRKSGNTLAI